LHELGVRQYECSVAFIGNARMQMIHRRYRHRDLSALSSKPKGRATNILSFPYGPAIGELFLAPAVIDRQARRDGIRSRQLTAHLLVHGVLHLQGWSHGTDRAAERMEARERRILRRLNTSRVHRTADHS
ncbi:MAG: rRNA maturation RNase YbeY, partial [Candidatus Kerfeldbacteria bacterium]|nr:rRNA maturation RNase YbeY [Candidatus Kerfeldbacteria bacterium]